MANAYDPYGSSGYGNSDLQFYSSSSGGAGSSGVNPHASTSSGLGSLSHTTTGGGGGGGDYYGGGGAMGSITSGGVGNGVGGAILSQGGFWTAFTAAPYFEGEQSLMEELGINFDHIKTKSWTVLNPLRRPDQHIMDDADLAGPLTFAFCFGMFLLLSGKPQFGYIYGVALLGDLAIYFLLNLMSPAGIDAYRVTSVLGYCLLPLVLTSLFSIGIDLNSLIGYVLSIGSVFWCSYAASGIFVSVLQMQNQRYLVAYPVMLFYASFALLTVFQHKVLVKS